jgi:hypothetical protein
VPGLDLLVAVPEPANRRGHVLRLARSGHLAAAGPGRSRHDVTRIITGAERRAGGAFPGHLPPHVMRPTPYATVGRSAPASSVSGDEPRS